MDSFYCSTAQELIQNTPPPGKIHVSVVEYPSQRGAVYLRLYADELHNLQVKKVDEIVGWLQSLLDKLNKLPLIGKYSYEISIKDPT